MSSLLDVRAVTKSFGVKVIDGDTFEFTLDPLTNIGDGTYAVSLAVMAITFFLLLGIIALALALVDSPEAAHPPLELFFTVDEETGLTGAFGNTNFSGWSRFSSGTMGSKSCPSAPSPCSQIMLPSGSAPVSISTVWVSDMGVPGLKGRAV